MSTLEKFGILVILILVVVIGVVAVWGVGGDEGANPFDAVPPADPVAQAPSPAELPPWPAASPPVAEMPVPPPVAPPVVNAPVTPPVAKTPAPAPLPAPVAGTVYRVQKGDTLTKIAAETLGDGNKWPLIVEANPGLDPRRMRINQEIVIPGGASVARSPSPTRPRVNSFVPNPDDGPTVPPAAPAAGGREVEVQKGDTLYGIALRELGDGGLYFKILKANPGIDPNRLRPGTRLRMPAAE